MRYMSSIWPVACPLKVCGFAVPGEGGAKVGVSTWFPPARTENYVFLHVFDPPADQNTCFYVNPNHVVLREFHAAGGTPLCARAKRVGGSKTTCFHCDLGGRADPALGGRG